MRDEVGVVFPLEFPDCKGMLLVLSTNLLSDRNRLDGAQTISKSLTTGQPRERKDHGGKWPP